MKKFHIASVLVWLTLLLFSFTAGAEEKHSPLDSPPPAGLTASEAIRLGEAMYRRGILPSGGLLTAYVQGDIEVQGPMLTCTNCHMRSGLGSFEGGVTTLPTNGAKLYAPLRTVSDLPRTTMGIRPLKTTRPAYTDATLAEALRNGVDPTGRLLSETMPHYVLSDQDMAILIYYLKRLSSTYSPGATLQSLRVATVVSDGVSAADRQSMLDPLVDFVKRFPRKVELDVWELKGPPTTWKEQLEGYDRNKPAFALLGGMVAGSWRPVHEFCETHQIPNLFPITNLPVISDTDWYTLYFSKGYYQEGDAVAKYLLHVLELPPEKRVVLVSRENDGGQALTQGFAEAWRQLGGIPYIEKKVAAGEPIGADYWKELVAAHPDAILVLWLDAKDLASAGTLAALPGKPSLLFVSHTMLDESFAAIPDSIRTLTHIAYPYGTPEERQPALRSVAQYYDSVRIRPANTTIGERTFGLFHLFSHAFNDMKNYRYRELLLDIFDMMNDQTGYGGKYPRLSFGPGQRYASKGCYIVTISEGPQPTITRKSDWVIY